MYLKQLEITGFKSFADRTRLDFEPGIIAIVGPNGCGKTNIVDAVRWVLGEQSIKRLRGSKMEDVIFQGSSERTGLGMAEVSLTIDNSEKNLPIEYSEVTVKRRVFRSGESHYFINKNLCRLKDVDSLFMDTGIGTRAYSVFEQGKMDLLLSIKPEERRFVFEEAAGISRYKEQKKETLRKLEITENNLIRLNDIIKEIHRHINSIERQAAKAKRYKKVRDELKALEVKDFIYKLRNLEQISEKYRNEKADVQEDSNRLEAVIKEKDERIKALRRDMQQLDKDSLLLQNEKLSVETQLAGGRQNLNYKTEKINELKQRMQDIEKETDLLDKSAEDLKIAIQNISKEISGVSKKKSDYKQILLKLQNVINDLRSQLQDVTSKAESKREALLIFSVKESQLKSELLHLEQEIRLLVLKERKDIVSADKKKDILNDFFSQIGKIEQMLQSKRHSLDALKQGLKNREEKVLVLKDNVLAVDSDIQKRQQFMAEKRSQYEIFSVEKKNYEGYTGGLKNILKNKERFPQFKAVLHDIFKVPERYSTAIGAVLGIKAQWIITDTIQDIYQLNSILKDNSISQVAFLIMDMIKDLPVISEDELSSGPYIARAIDVVRYDKIYDKLAKYLLGRVVITKDFETAAALLEKADTDITIATLDGMAFDSCGFVKAGIQQNSINLIGRDSTIEKLKGQLQGVSEEILELIQKKNLLEDKLKTEEGHMERAKNNLYNEEVALGVLENDFIKHKAKHEQLSEEIQVSELEHSGALEQKNKLNAELKNKTSELEDCSNSIQDINLELKKISAEVSSMEQARLQREREYTESKVNMVSVEDKENHLAFKIEQLQNQFNTARTNIDKLKKEKAESENIIKQLSEEISKLKSTINRLGQRSGLIEEKYNKNRALGSDLGNELSEIEDSIMEERTRKDKLIDELNARHLKLSEIELKSAAIIKKLQDEYKIGEDAVKDYIIDNASIDTLGEQILSYRNKLEAMGEVNLVAIEEYEKLQERYEFLTNQRQDLVGAKESLLKVIAKINTTTKKLFRNTFEEIRKYFKEMFSLLFEGGKADLVLINELDILESGIEIIARPPGKKLQNVSLLSGGEKALTGIALLFAMFKVKPSPFCILDEIDAPLDESNIDRFLNLLKKFSKTTQFMVITHNKRTVTIARALYGITMQENGISKVISVKLPESVPAAR